MFGNVIGGYLGSTPKKRVYAGINATIKVICTLALIIPKMVGEKLPRK